MFIESNHYYKQDNSPNQKGSIGQLQSDFITHSEEAAPDLKSNNLATLYAEALFRKLQLLGAKSEKELCWAGNREYYRVGKEVLGPLAVSFTDFVLQQSPSTHIVCPARDATPFYHIARTLTSTNPEKYGLQLEDIHNPVFNRKLWGIDDELDEGETSQVTDPLVKKLLAQIGFGGNKPLSFIEVGAWGSMVDQLNTAMKCKKLPQTEFSVYFLFTHLPQFIYGFTNHHGSHVSDSVLETIADTWEAFPKFFKRPTTLIEEDGRVTGSLAGQVIPSPFLASWARAATMGVIDAAHLYIRNSLPIDPEKEISRLWELSKQAQEGVFTGVLPGHTQTWSEGSEWKKNWKWGKVSPLK